MYMNLPQRHGDTEKITIPNLSWFALSSVPLCLYGVRVTRPILTVCPDLQQHAARDRQYLVLFWFIQFQPQNTTGRKACAFPLAD